MTDVTGVTEQSEQTEPEAVPVTVVGLSDRPLARAGVASVELDGEVVLLDDTGLVHMLNPIAGLLWACFDGQGALGEIAVDVAEVFGVPRAEVEAQVIALAQDLVDHGLVTVGEASLSLPRSPDPEDASTDSIVVLPGGY